MVSRYSTTVSGLLLAAMFAASTCVAQAADDTKATLLWPDGAPGAVGTDPEDKPLLWEYPAADSHRNGTAVVICPGGGYGILAVDHEGTQIARWFNSIGVTAFVLKYRLAPRYHHPTMMNDAQRAIQFVRAHAADYQIDPHRVGVMGFSAGGHLASTAATHFAAAQPDSPDPVARVSSRPDFAVLGYPVISMTESFGHGGSKKNLLGDQEGDAALAELLSNDKQVTPETPPTFIFHTLDDTGVPVENALAFYTALRKHKVPSEIHIYEIGPHGVGLAPGHPSLFTWKDRLGDWLRDTGKLATFERATVSGKVTLKGEPLKWGQVTLRSKTSPDVPVVFAMVHGGNFSIARERGPAPGEYTFDVVYMGTVQNSPSIPDAKTLTNGELTVKIVPGDNTLNINLP